MSITNTDTRVAIEWNCGKIEDRSKDFEEGTGGNQDGEWQEEGTRNWSRTYSKGNVVISTEELMKELEKAEKATKARKNMQGEKRTLNSSGDTEESDTGDHGSPRDTPTTADPEILDCIEVSS